MLERATALCDMCCHPWKCSRRDRISRIPSGVLCVLCWIAWTGVAHGDQPPPNLTVVITTNPLLGVNSGQVVTYTSVVTNEGKNPSVATEVVLTDSISPYSYWGVNSYGVGVASQFTDGGTVSGLTPGPPSYSERRSSPRSGCHRRWHN